MLCQVSICFCPGVSIEGKNSQEGQSADALVAIKESVCFNQAQERESGRFFCVNIFIIEGVSTNKFDDESGNGAYAGVGLNF